jgi:hypothetical protein
VRPTRTSGSRSTSAPRSLRPTATVENNCVHPHFLRENWTLYSWSGCRSDKNLHPYISDRSIWVPFTVVIWRNWSLYYPHLIIEWRFVK